MKEWKRGFAGGVAASVLCASLVGTAFAANYQKQATLDYTGIKLKVNGETVTPKDANGNPVEPFAINGTTYLPVRAVGNALGLDVGWDPATQTVILSEHVDGTSTASGTVIVDQSGVKVTYTGIREAQGLIGDYEICLKIENNSNVDLGVSSEDVSVNGMMVDDYLVESVAAGKTAIAPIAVYGLEDKGVKAPITSAEFKLHFYDKNTYKTYFDTDAINVK